jgi:hypothetical protein
MKKPASTTRFVDPVVAIAKESAVAKQLPQGTSALDINKTSP